MNTNTSPLRILAVVVAGLCAIAVLAGFTGDVEPIKLVAVALLATLIALFV